MEEEQKEEEIIHIVLDLGRDRGQLSFKIPDSFTFSMALIWHPNVPWPVYELPHRHLALLAQPGIEDLDFGQQATLTVDIIKLSVAIAGSVAEILKWTEYIALPKSQIIIKQRRFSVKSHQVLDKKKREKKIDNPEVYLAQENWICKEPRCFPAILFIARLLKPDQAMTNRRTHLLTSCTSIFHK